MADTTTRVRSEQMVSANAGSPCGDARIDEIVDHLTVGVRRNADAAEK